MSSGSLQRLLLTPEAQLVGGKMITYSGEGPIRKQGSGSDWIPCPRALVLHGRM